MTRSTRHWISGTAAALLPSAAILAALWLPFGFSMTGLIEEWDLLGLFATQGSFFRIHFDGPLAAHSLRPLMPLSFAMAYIADRDSFVGAHWLTLTALLIKGGAMTYLARRATGSRAWGIVAGVLFLLYPADTMQLSFRSLHINAAIALSLAGCALLLCAFQARTTVRATGTAVVAALLYLVGICMYEASLTLIALPWAVLFVRYGWKRKAALRSRQIGLAALWPASAFVYVAYAAWRASTITSYQGQVAGGKQSLFATLYAALPKLFSVGGARALIGGWMDAARMIATEYASFLYLACAVGGIALVVLFAIRFREHGDAGSTDNPPVSLAIALRLVLAGVVLMFMGYAPFLISPAHIAISQRTFLWATPGATLAWVGLLIVLWRFARVPAVAASLVLLVLGLGAQLYQFHHYVNLSERQRSVLRAIVERVDAPSPGKTLLVLDGTNQLGHTWFFPGDGLYAALGYLYGHSVGRVEICRTTGMEWQRPDALGRKGVCVEDGTGWTLESPSSVSGPGVAPTVPEPPHRLAKEQVMVVAVGADDASVPPSVLAERRRQLQTGTETIDRRYRGVLAPRSPGLIGPMFRDQFVGDSYRWDFGDWWNLDVPPRGAGWREVEWTGDGLSHRAGAWKTGPTADLNFELAPTAGRYIVRGQFGQFAGDDIRDSIGLRINGRSLPLQWTSPLDFKVDVPPGILARGANRVEFVSALNDRYYGLSAWLDWVEVRSH